MDVLAILFVVGAEFREESWFLVKGDEEVDGQGDCQDGGDGLGVGVAENDPEADPAGGEAFVHGVAHVAIETHHDQALRRSDWGRGAASGPAEVPDAAKGDGESQHGGKRSEPSPMCGAGHFHGETQPFWQEPEP